MAELLHDAAPGAANDLWRRLMDVRWPVTVTISPPLAHKPVYAAELDPEMVKRIASSGGSGVEVKVLAQPIRSLTELYYLAHDKAGDDGVQVDVDDASVERLQPQADALGGADALERSDRDQSGVVLVGDDGRPLQAGSGPGVEMGGGQLGHADGVLRSEGSEDQPTGDALDLREAHFLGDIDAIRLIGDHDYVRGRKAWRSSRDYPTIEKNVVTKLVLANLAKVRHRDGRDRVHLTDLGREIAGLSKPAGGERVQ